MSYAQELLEEGRAEGREEGLQRGKVEAVEGFLRIGVSWDVITSATGIDEPRVPRSQGTPCSGGAAARRAGMIRSLDTNVTHIRNRVPPPQPSVRVRIAGGIKAIELFNRRAHELKLPGVEVPVVPLPQVVGRVSNRYLYDGSEFRAGCGARKRTHPDGVRPDGPANNGAAGPEHRDDGDSRGTAVEITSTQTAQVVLVRRRSQQYSFYPERDTPKCGTGGPAHPVVGRRMNVVDELVPKVVNRPALTGPTPACK